MPIDSHVLAVFLLTTTVAMVTPGPDMLFVLGCGMRGGPRAGLLATAGVATSEAVHMAVAAAVSPAPNWRPHKSDAGRGARAATTTSHQLCTKSP